MSEHSPQPDLDPAVEYAFLCDDMQESLRQACVDDTAASRIGSNGRSMILASGIATLHEGDSRIVILVDYSEPPNNDDPDSGPSKTMQVFGGLDATPNLSMRHILTVCDEGYDSENKTPFQLQADADRYDRARQLLRAVEFTKEYSEGICNGFFYGVIGEPIVGETDPRPAEPEAAETERQTKIRQWAGRIAGLLGFKKSI